MQIKPRNVNFAEIGGEEYKFCGNKGEIHKFCGNRGKLTFFVEIGVEICDMHHWLRGNGCP